MSKRIFIVAGEMSGDTHGALLMEQLQLLMPDCIIEGIGGPSMEARGLRSIVEFSQMNVSGFLEVLKSYPKLLSILRQAKQAISNGEYDAFIAIDYPGFNMRLGAFAKSLNIHSICYIAPQ
jgi:lipid-A-disaccharide synthase